MNFSGYEHEIIYDAVRYYQMNKIPTDSKLYWECDVILSKLFSKVKLNDIEPGLRVDT